MDLTPVERKFVLHWGEMGTRWGVNRVVAQVHALLLLSPAPLDAGEIASTLAVARSSVSTGLRELQGWGIIRVTHQMGDRKDYFESMKDVWEMFRVVMDERKKRECDPTQALLRQRPSQEDRPTAPSKRGNTFTRFGGSPPLRARIERAWPRVRGTTTSRPCEAQSAR